MANYSCVTCSLLCKTESTSQIRLRDLQTITLATYFPGTSTFIYCKIITVFLLQLPFCSSSCSSSGRASAPARKSCALDCPNSNCDDCASFMASVGLPYATNTIHDIYGSLYLTIQYLTAWYSLQRRGTGCYRFVYILTLSFLCSSVGFFSLYSCMRDLVAIITSGSDKISESGPQ